MKRHALALVAAILLGSALPDTIIAQSSRLPPTERPRMIPKEERLPSDQSGSQRQDPSRQEQTGQDPSRQDPAQSAGDDDSTIKIDTTLVTIPVTVLDRDGKYIPNLTKRNFQLWEDDIQQEISDFTSVEVPFNVVLLLDTSRSTVFRLEDIQRAAVAFVEQLRPEDRVMVVSFDDKVYVDSEFTSDRARLRRAIYQTRTGGGTKLYDAVDLVISERLNRVDGRKAIVLFTDGVDTTSRLANAASTLEQVEESDVLVYPIRYDTEGQLNRPPIYGPNGPTINIPWPLPRLPRGRRWPVAPQWPRGGAPDDYRRAEGYLRNLAQRSGGRLQFAETIQNVDQAFALIAEELRHQYALSYYPSNAARDGSYRRIRVRVDRPNLAVRTRDGYRADDARPAEAARERRVRPALSRKGDDQ